MEHIDTMTTRVCEILMHEHDMVLGDSHKNCYKNYVGMEMFISFDCVPVACYVVVSSDSADYIFNNLSTCNIYVKYEANIIWQWPFR